MSFWRILSKIPSQINKKRNSRDFPHNGSNELLRTWLATSDYQPRILYDHTNLRINKTSETLPGNLFLRSLHFVFDLLFITTEQLNFQWIIFNFIHEWAHFNLPEMAIVGVYKTFSKTHQMRMKANRFLKFLLVYNKSLELLSRLFHVENLELHNKILITTPRRLNGILFKSQIYS